MGVNVPKNRDPPPSNSDTNGMLPLGPDHINGIRLVLRLSPSINSNFGTVAGSANGSYYELSDVSLTYSAAVPNGNMLPKMKSLPFTKILKFLSKLLTFLLSFHFLVPV